MAAGHDMQSTAPSLEDVLQVLEQFLAGRVHMDFLLTSVSEILAHDVTAAHAVQERIDRALRADELVESVWERISAELDHALSENAPTDWSEDPGTAPQPADSLSDTGVSIAPQGPASGPPVLEDRVVPATATAQANGADMQPGTLLGDRYVIVSRAHTGGMGDVYKALDRTRKEAGDPDPWVAVKVIGQEFARHPQALAVLEREARNCRSLSHDNIVRVFDFERDGDSCFITMEWLEGESLVQFLERARQKTPNVNQLKRIILGLGAALAHAHAKGITHADVKPGNVFVTHNGEVKLLDFGAAHDAAGKNGGSLEARTPAYSSCEVLEGNTPSPSDDVFSFALVVYRLLAGQRAFDQSNALDAEASGLVPQRVPSLADQAWQALLKGLAFRRADRPADVTSFLEAFTAPPAAPGQSATAETLAPPADGTEQPLAVPGEAVDQAAIEPAAETSTSQTVAALAPEAQPEAAPNSDILATGSLELDDTGSGWGRPILVAASVLACAGAALWFWTSGPEPMPVAASPRAVAPAARAAPMPRLEETAAGAVPAERMEDSISFVLIELPAEPQDDSVAAEDIATLESVALVAVESGLTDDPQPDAQLASVAATPAVSPPAREAGETLQIAVPDEAPLARAKPKPQPKAKPKPQPKAKAQPKPAPVTEREVAAPAPATRESAGSVAETQAADPAPATPQRVREAPPPAKRDVDNTGELPKLTASFGPPVPERASPSPDDYGPLPAPGPPTPPEVAMSELDFDRFVEPRYPRSRAARKKRGWVEVQFQVNADGETSDVKILGSSPPEVFDQAALDAVSRWRFKPQVVAGEPMAVTSIVRLRFEPQR